MTSYHFSRLSCIQYYSICQYGEYRPQSRLSTSSNRRSISLLKYTKCRGHSNLQMCTWKISSKNCRNKITNNFPYTNLLHKFIFNLKFYLQIKSRSMGNIFASSYINISMAYCEQKFNYPKLKDFAFDSLKISI